MTNAMLYAGAGFSPDTDWPADHYIAPTIVTNSPPAPPRLPATEVAQDLQQWAKADTSNWDADTLRWAYECGLAYIAEQRRQLDNVQEKNSQLNTANEKLQEQLSQQKAAHDKALATLRSQLQSEIDFNAADKAARQNAEARMKSAERKEADALAKLAKLTSEIRTQRNKACELGLTVEDRQKVIALFEALLDDGGLPPMHPSRRNMTPRATYQKIEIPLDGTPGEPIPPRRDGFHRPGPSQGQPAEPKQTIIMPGGAGTYREAHHHAEAIYEKLLAESNERVLEAVERGRAERAEAGERIQPTRHNPDDLQQAADSRKSAGFLTSGGL